MLRHSINKNNKEQISSLPLTSLIHWTGPWTFHLSFDVCILIEFLKESISTTKVLKGTESKLRVYKVIIEERKERINDRRETDDVPISCIRTHVRVCVCGTLIIGQGWNPTQLRSLRGIPPSLKDRVESFYTRYQER